MTRVNFIKMNILAASKKNADNLRKFSCPGTRVENSYFDLINKIKTPVSNIPSLMNHRISRKADIYY